MKSLSLILFIFSSFMVSANDCSSLKEDYPVLAGGRVKPFYVLAKESVKFLTGKSKFHDEPPTKTFCRLLQQSQTGTTLNLPLLVEHIDSKKLLGVNKAENSAPAQKLVNKKDLVRSEIFKQKENNSYKKDLNKIWARIDMFEKIVAGTAFKIYQGPAKITATLPPEQQDQINASEWITYSEIPSESLDESLKNAEKNYLSRYDDDHQLELSFTKSHIFSYAMLTALIGIFLTVLSKKMIWGIAFALITVGVEIAGLTMRVLISGRAPITNMYETVLFSGFGALVISLLVLFFKKDKMFLLAGLGYNILCLFMMMFANNMLDSSISPLVPVLRDNFWLSTHVTTIILSYAALALSWMVANITLIRMRFGTLSKADYRYYQDLTYTCIKIGIVLLAAGIILGGVWADYSWGRFWGWDPKETWSLIVLLFYMVIVHGRYSSWIDTHRFIVLSAAGFMSVMMAWFGVNYILASGLHSYGFSEGGAIFLGSFFLVQTIIILICGSKRTFKKVSSP